MAISVTTGNKLDIKKNPYASNIIPGFGYSVLDVFENQYVDMESIAQTKIVEEESKSPFKSPQKSRRQTEAFGLTIKEATSEGYSPVKSFRGSSPTKSMRRVTSKERRAFYEEQEQLPPKQYQLIQVKTAVTRYPAINCVSPFTNEEIMEGKRCLLNHYKRTPEAQQRRRTMIANQLSPSKRRRTRL